jgi:PAS domain S-box-containing protein
VSARAQGVASARALVPAAILVPIALGGIAVLGEHAGVFDAAFGTVFLAAGNAMAFSLLAIGAARAGKRQETVQTALVRNAVEHEAQSRFAERFRQLVEWAPVGISVVQDGRLAFVNRRIGELLRYERAEDMVGLDALAIIHPDDRELAAVRVSSGALQPLPSRVTRCVRRDGSTIVLELSAAPGVFEGRPAMISVARDVTAELEAERAECALVRALAEREKTVAELNRSEQVHRTILRHLPRAATVMVDRDLRYVRADGSILHDLLPNRGSVDCVGHPVGDLVSDASRVEVLRILRSALDGAAVRIEQRRGDSYFEVDAVPIFEEARVAFALLVVHDVTSRRAELAKVQAMLQEIHHRVKNNLQMITSLLNLQARQAASDEARAAFRETLGRVRSMAILHDGLYQSEDLGRIDMRDYVDKLLAMIQRAFSDARASFVADVERVVLPVDLAIPCGLIVNELVTNALKHAFGSATPSLANEIRVELHPRGEDLAISVIDNGLGLSLETASGHRESLGLTLVHDLCSQLRGRAEFVVAGGTRCTVTFPAPGQPKGAIS